MPLRPTSITMMVIRFPRDFSDTVRGLDEQEFNSMLRRVIVTGSSGYIGSKLVERFQSQGVVVMGVDVREPRKIGPDQFVKSDICDPALAKSFQEFAPDTVLHAAFIVNPIHDEVLMHHINVDGTRNVLAAIANLSLKRFMLFSSATAYGAWRENPVPIDELQPVRARPDFRYAADKVEIEHLVDEFARQHPTVAVSCVRPAVVGGPGMDNYLRQNIFSLPVMVRFERCDHPVQFVHEDDVVDSILTILEADGRGPYNIAPPDWTSSKVLARETKRFLITLPFWLVEPVANLTWKIRFPLFHSPPGYLTFCRYPWVVTPRRLCSELGFQFRHSSIDTIQATFRGMDKSIQRQSPPKPKNRQFANVAAAMSRRR